MSKKDNSARWIAAMQEGERAVCKEIAEGGASEAPDVIGRAVSVLGAGDKNDGLCNLR